MREGGAAVEARRPENEAALAEALARHRTAEGVMLATSSWMVSAQSAVNGPRLDDALGRVGLGAYIPAGCS